MERSDQIQEVENLLTSWLLGLKKDEDSFSVSFLGDWVGRRMPRRKSRLGWLEKDG